MVNIKSKIVWIIDDQEFEVNDMVNIQTTYINEYIGRISEINESYIDLDISYHYNSNIIRLSSCDILHITK